MCKGIILPRIIYFTIQMKKFRLAYKIILHFLFAPNTRGFGVHSPFMFNFTRNVLYERHRFYSFEAIENVRTVLIKDNRVLNVIDYGTGYFQKRTIADIAKKSLKSPKQAQLFYRIANYMKVQNVLVLGTSLGLTSSYLASSSTKIHCVSLEGCPAIAQVAQDNFDKLGIQNIKLIIGNIDATLTQVLNESEPLDLIFIDANHRKEAVLRYFDQCLSKVHKDTILIVDDIYWSSEMEQAWHLIKLHPFVSSTIDLFQMGIVFFNTDLHKMNYKMRI